MIEIDYDYRTFTLENLNVIELSKNNLNLIKNKEVLFIEDSNDGETFLMDKNSKIYHVNRLYNDSLNEEDIFLVLKDYADTMNSKNKPYEAINLGAGHALLIRREIYIDFMNLLKSQVFYENEYEDFYNAYCAWIGCAIQFLKSNYK